MDTPTVTVAYSFSHQTGWQSFFFFVFLFCARAPTVLVACNMTLADYMLGIVILKWHVTSYTEEVTVPPGLWG